MFSMKIDTSKQIEDFSRQEWQYILEKGAFRGKKIHRAAKAIELNALSSMTYNSNTQSVLVNGKFSLDLNEIKGCPSTKTFARLKYWLRKNVFCQNQIKQEERVKKLADLIYDKLHASSSISLPVERLQEKQQWKEYKESWRDLDIGCLEAMTSPKHYDKLQQTNFSDSHKELLAQALKVRELYSETHYTFIHAQCLSYWVINQFVKELIKISNPHQDLSCFHFFRSKIDTKKVNAKEIIHERIWDSDSYFRKKLLSVDAYFFNTNIGESANDYLSNNESDWHGETEIIDDILGSYLGIFPKEILYKLLELSQEYQKLATIGNLYAICVPKEKINEMAFRAHPYGIPCKCEKKPIKILNDLQNDNVKYTKCKAIAPQYRIVTDQLNPKDNRIFLLSPVAKDIKDSYKLELSKIAQEVYDLKHK